MKAFFAALLVVTVGFGFAVEDAEAKRFGGGKSFGSKKMFSTPFNRSAPKKQTAPAAPGKAAPGAAAAGGAAAVGAKSGMMGMLGGLAIGGMLGALFFGGAFENINFLDILIFGGIAFLLFKLFASRRRGMGPASGRAQAAGGAPTPDADWNDASEREYVQQRANTSPASSSTDRGFDTDIMFKDKTDSSITASVPQSIPSGYVAPEKVSFPKGFNQDEFMGGAKNAFTMLQDAWDHGELADIRGLTTDKVFGEVQDQFFDRNGENKTEILEATAEIIDFNESDSEQ
ncbi:MAG: TIM44-like domain-containing protein, partial [Gammaproteobacteria bacterium]|nr:TIM44-like domain-containing protein [Gammaproteobacteria bacterium]